MPVRRSDSRHDVRVVQAGGSVGLAAESPLEGRVLGDVRGQHLEGYGAVGSGVVGPPDLTHAAAAEQTHQPIAPERCAFHQPPILPASES